MLGNHIIDVEHLVIAFGNFKAVDDISFSVCKGEIFGFLGANGAGKTTTIRTLCGLLSPTSGQVKINGKDVSNNVGILKQQVGYMSQKFTLYPDLTIKENMSLAGSLYDMTAEQISKRSKELFDFIGLTEIPNYPTKQLSGGLKQMVALAASILHDPELIFLDEPTAGTSIQTRLSFWKLIKNLATEGKTIFVTTHYMDEAENCDHIVLMSHGKILANDSPSHLKTTYFPNFPIEITFKGNSLSLVSEEIKRLHLGIPAVYGKKLRVMPFQFKSLITYCKSHQDLFAYQEVPPSLEDVFLKAISRGNEATL